MPRFVWAFVALIIASVPTQVYAEGVELSLYPQFKGDSVIFADTRLPDSGESIVDDGEVVESPFAKRPKKLEEIVSSSQNFFAGKSFGIVSLGAGLFRNISSPETRGGEGPFAQIQLRYEWRVYLGKKDPKTSRRIYVYLGPTVLLNASLYDEANWESQSGLGGVGLSLTFGEGDGLLGKFGDRKNFGRWAANLQLMAAFRHQNGKTKDDNYELKHDQAYGLYVAGSFSLYAFRLFVGEQKEYKVDDKLWGKRHIYGNTMFLRSLDLNFFAFIPVSQDRKDSLIGTTSKGPDNLFGYVGLTADLFTVSFSFLGMRGQFTPLGSGINIRFQEYLRRSGTEFRLGFDPGIRAHMKVELSDWFSLLGYADGVQSSFRDSKYGVFGGGLDIKF